jgi:hypothetical protein
MKAFQTMLLVSMVCILGIACGAGSGSTKESANPQQDIVGSWSCDDGMNLTFSSDGALVYSGTLQFSGGSIEKNGTQNKAFTDSKHIIGGWEFNTPTYEVHLSGDTLALKAGSGSTITCSRQ